MKINERLAIPCYLFSGIVWIGVAYLLYKLLAGSTG